MIDDNRMYFGNRIVGEAVAVFAAVVTMVTYPQFLDFFIKGRTLKKEETIINGYCQRKPCKIAKTSTEGG